MPAKYSHVKKRSANAQPRKTKKNSPSAQMKVSLPSGHAHRNPNPHLDRSISQAMLAVSELERAISRVLLIRYEQDIGRLYSTRLHGIALIYLPKLVLDCVNMATPAWAAVNADCDEIKDFFRSAIAMDMRQAGERVATKSVLWSYTALRHFALSNNVPICQKTGLHSLRLLPHFDTLKVHLEALEAMPIATFKKPANLPRIEESFEVLADDIAARGEKSGRAWEDWRTKVRIGYERAVDTLWNVAREFDVRGYGVVLREKLTTKWCDCGCSTDHLGEVCERTVREEEEESGVRFGKQREWDGRGSGIYGWETDEEEDLWEVDLDFGGLDTEECDDLSPEMTVGEHLEWRYFKAERAKELGNKQFRSGNFQEAIKQYTIAHQIESELPHYQLNIAAAHLKLSNWMAAEKACNIALGQHRSSKGYWRRAKARKMLGRYAEAAKDLREVLKLQPDNPEALAELMSLMPASESQNTPSKKHKDYADDYGGSGSSTNGLPSSSHRDPPYSLSTSKRKPWEDLPFEINDSDRRKLKIFCPPLEVEMPLESKGKRKPSLYQSRVETYHYPTWERCTVQRIPDSLY